MAKKQADRSIDQFIQDTIAQYDRVEQAATPRVLAYLNSTRKQDQALLAKTMAKFKKPRGG